LQIFPYGYEAFKNGRAKSESCARAAAEKKFAETMPPVEALRAWMLLFVDYIAAKQIIAPALNTFIGGPSKLYEGSRAQIQGAIDGLVKRAIKSGDIRADLEPFDLLRALIGVSKRGVQPWLAAKCQEAGRHPHQRFATGAAVREMMAWL
jgi:hypothetical protein